MKYISLLNPITIKYLIDNPNTKYFIINTLKLILNAEDFELLNYFTHEEENVRSYTIFKNKSKIVLMDYNINENKEPLFYVRNVSEGSYTQNLQSTFNPNNNTLVLVDKKHTDRPAKTVKVPNDIQDILSCFYYLRSQPSENLRVGSTLKMNVWIDDEVFPFQLKVVGTENISTKFGKINCLKIVPSVISGRVFKAKEGVTLWVSNDQNKVPILIKAELAVGSLKASIDSFSNVKYPLSFKK